MTTRGREAGAAFVLIVSTGVLASGCASHPIASPAPAPAASAGRGRIRLTTFRRLVLAIGVLLVVHDSSWAQASDTAREDVLVVPGTPDDYWKAASLAGVAPTGPR